jgi:hypothetical protein
MEMQVIRGSNIHRLCQAVGSNRRKVNIRISTHYSLSPSAGRWDGGSKLDEFYFQGVQSVGLDRRALAPVTRITLDLDHAIVVAGTFCGKPAIPYIYCTQEYHDKYLKS